MGKKSRRKRNRFEKRAEIEKVNNQQKNIVYLTIFSVAALFIWGKMMFDRTFISTISQIKIALIGTTLGISIVMIIRRYRSYGFIETIIYGFIWGTSFTYCLIGTTNYYFRDKQPQNVQLPIIETGNRSGRKSACRTPYAVIELQNIRKDILFECEYEKSISNYKSLTLTVSKGFWGYTVYTDHFLDVL